MNFTYNLELDKVKKPNEKSALYLRITYSRASKRMKLGHSIQPKYWKKKTNSKRKYISKNCPDYKLCTSAERKLTNKAQVFIESNESATLQSVIEHLKNENPECFIDYGIKHYEKNKLTKSVSYYNTSKGKFKLLIQFNKSNNLKFSTINKQFVNDYITWRIETSQVTHTTLLDGDLKIFKATFNKALEENTIAHSALNPFTVKHLKREPVQKEKLTIKEFKKLELYTSKNIKRMKALDIFLLSIYCGGTRISDTLQFTHENIKLIDKEKWISYKTGKTKDYMKTTFPVQAERIIEKYNSHFLIPYLNKADILLDRELIHNKLKSLTTTINKQLRHVSLECKLNMKLTCHIARHSYASMLLEAGLSTEEIQKLLGHKDIKITIRYLADIDPKHAYDVHKNLFS